MFGIIISENDDNCGPPLRILIKIPHNGHHELETEYYHFDLVQATVSEVSLE